MDKYGDTPQAQLGGAKDVFHFFNRLCSSEATGALTALGIGVAKHLK